MKDKKRAPTEMVSVESDCGRRVYRCDEQRCELVGDYSVCA
jgi:hypothetical protein